MKLMRAHSSLVATCQPDDSQVSVWKTAQHLADGLLGRGRAVVESAEELLLRRRRRRGVWGWGGGGTGENTVRRGYFHDPISIREAKLFMPSA